LPTPAVASCLGLNYRRRLNESGNWSCHDDEGDCATACALVFHERTVTDTLRRALCFMTTIQSSNNNVGEPAYFYLLRIDPSPSFKNPYGQVAVSAHSSVNMCFDRGLARCWLVRH